MFNPIYEVPMQMFSTQHIIALIVIFAIIAAIFFSRKFFMKSVIADRIFRYSLAFILIGFELTLQFLHNPTPIFTRFMVDTYPLCGYMIWFTSFALITDSKRLMKIIYPFTLLGGLLSIIVLDVHSSFPHFGAIQFFSIHAGFMFGSLYFMFTQKITKYTFADLKRSFIFVAGIASYMLLVCNGKLSYDPNFGDPFFIITPPGGLEFIKEALGQIGYSILYILLITTLLFSIFGVTKLCTSKRKDSCPQSINIKQNKFFDKLSSYTLSKQLTTIFIIYVFGVAVATIGKVTNLVFLNYINIICFMLFYTALILFELTHNYKVSNKQSATNVDNDKK